MKSIKKLLVGMIVLVFMISMVTATAYAVSAPSEKKDTSIVKIDSKSKTVSYKITWNGNGGKIGTKKTIATTVKKGSKINKLATSPKRNGYTFKGWYTAKTGGKKITKNTVPTKSVTYYAHWTRVLTATEKKLVGTWYSSTNGSNIEVNRTYTFRKDGTFSSICSEYNYYYRAADFVQEKGSWKISGNKISFSKVQVKYNLGTWGTGVNSNFRYSLGSDKKGKFLLNKDLNVKIYKIIV